MSKKSLKHALQRNKVVAVKGAVLNRGKQDEKQLYDLYRIQGAN